MRPSVCAVACVAAVVMPRPLRGAVTAVGQLRSGAIVSELRAGQAGREAAQQFDGRRKAGPKGTAARKRLQLHWGCFGGGGGVRGE